MFNKVKPVRSVPLKTIENELIVNSKAGLTSCLLQAEDVLLFGSNGINPQESEVLELHELAKKYFKVVNWTESKVSSIAQNPQIIADISKVLIDDNQKWWTSEIGLELGSPSTLDGPIFKDMIKPFNSKTWKKAVMDSARIMAESKLLPTYTLVVNLPVETEDDINCMADMVERLRQFPSFIIPVIFVPLSSSLSSDSDTKEISPPQQELVGLCFKHDLKWAKNFLDEYFESKFASWFLKDTLKLYIPSEQISNLRNPINDLKNKLGNQENRESEYQKFLIRYPWVIGAQYVAIQSHTKLNDVNIPDFTAVRARDNLNDIIEIKQPFLRLFEEMETLAQSLMQHGIKRKNI